MVMIKRGFTIVELLIVIVVIAVLASITIVAYSGIRTQAQVAVLKNNIQSAATAMEAYRGLNNSYPTSINSLNNGSGLQAGDSASFTFHSDGSSYCISINATNAPLHFLVTHDNTTPREGQCPQDLGAQVELLAGNGTLGFANATGSAAALASPTGLTAGPAGVLYFTDASTSRIRQVTTAGAVTTFAGNGASGTTEGSGNAALFNWPQALTVGPGNHLYIADSNNQRIRLLPLPTGTTSTFAGLSTTATTTGFADGTGTAARFNVPRGIAYDSVSGFLYVSDSQNHRIRRISPTQVVDTYAGNANGGYLDSSTATTARFNYPQGIAIAADGTLYIADTNNHRIRAIAPSGAVTTVAGGTAGNQDGVGTAARFTNPNAITIASNGTLYVADTNNHSIRKITPDGTVTTIAGNGSAGYANGAGTAAQFNTPRGIAIGSDGRLYVADTANHRIRVLTNI